MARRQVCSFTLSDEAAEKLRDLADVRRCSASRVVEDLILEAKTVATVVAEQQAMPEESRRVEPTPDQRTAAAVARGQNKPTTTLTGRPHGPVPKGR